MAQPLFHDQQDHGLSAGFGIDDALRAEPDPGQPRRKQIAALQAPQNGTAQAGEHPGDEQSRCRFMGDVRLASGDLVQGSQGEPPFGQAIVDFRNIEGKDRAEGILSSSAPLDPADSGPQHRKCLFPLASTHVPNFPDEMMFLICSHNASNGSMGRVDLSGVPGR